MQECDTVTVFLPIQTPSFVATAPSACSLLSFDHELLKLKNKWGLSENLQHKAPFLEKFIMSYNGLES